MKRTTLRTNTTNNNTKGGTKKMGLIKLEGKKWSYYVALDKKTPDFIIGSIYRTEGDTKYSRRISWRVDKYDTCGLSDLTAIKTSLVDGQEATIKSVIKWSSEEAKAKACSILSDRIVEELDGNNNHAVTKVLLKYFGEGNEVAATIESTPTPVANNIGDKPKVMPTKEAMDFMKANEVKGMAALNLAVTKIQELETAAVNVTEDVEVTTEDLYAMLQSLTEEERQELIYDFIPSELLSAQENASELMEELDELKNELISVKDTHMETEYNHQSEAADLMTQIVELKEELASKDEDNTPDPDDKMPIPVAPAFDIEELKASLKAEIITELREEFKASLAPAVAPITKPAVTVDTTPVVEEKTVSEEAPIVEEDIVPVPQAKKKATKTKTPNFRNMRQNFNTAADTTDDLADIEIEDDFDLDVEMKELELEKKSAAPRSEVVDKIVTSAAQKRAARKAAREAARLSGDVLV